MRQNVLQANDGRNFQESEVLLPNDELFYVLPSDGFRERSDQAFMRVRKDTQQQQVDPDPLSSFVDQWVRVCVFHTVVKFKFISYLRRDSRRIRIVIIQRKRYVFQIAAKRSHRKLVVSNE